MERSPVDDVQQQDIHNYTEIRKDFANEVRIPDDLVHTYDLGVIAIRPMLLTQADQFANAFLFGLCRKHLVLGAASLFRLHSGQMFRETRSAVETAGIAHVIHNDPEKLQIFLDDDGRAAQRKTAKRIFRPETIFPSTEPIMLLLRRHYDLASKRSHMNMVNFVLHLASTTDPFVANVSVQDIQKERLDEELPILLFWLCQVHLSILMSVSATFPNLPSTPEFLKFNKEIVYVHGKITRFNKRHKEHLAQVAMPDLA